MKKVIAQILTIILILGILAGNVSAASFGVTLSSNKQTVKPGGEVVITIGVNDIDIEGGINSVEGILNYDKNIFEPVTQENISPLNGWAPSYNDEESELNGKFLAIKLSAGVTKEEGVFTVKLKVKEGIKEQNTTILIKDITTTDGGTIINTKEKSIIIKIDNNDTTTPGGNDNNQGGDNNQGSNNQGGNNNQSENNNQGGNNNQGSNNQGGNSNQGNNNSGNNGTNTGNKDNTGYNSGKLPQTGTNGNIIIAIGILLAIGVGSLVKYRSMK